MVTLQHVHDPLLPASIAFIKFWALLLDNKTDRLYLSKTLEQRQEDSIRPSEEVLHAPCNKMQVESFRYWSSQSYNSSLSLGGLKFCRATKLVLSEKHMIFKKTVHSVSRISPPGCSSTYGTPIALSFEVLLYTMREWGPRKSWDQGWSYNFVGGFIFQCYYLVIQSSTVPVLTKNCASRGLARAIRRVVVQPF